MNVNLDDIKVFIFDLDGCVYSGNKINKGAKELISYLNEMDKDVYFLSNNSIDSSQTVQNKLEGMDIHVEKKSILVATELVGEYLFDHYGATNVISIGSKQLIHALKDKGHQVISIDSEEKCDYVVCGLDKTFTYEMLFKCTQKVRNGAKIIATNMDQHHPDENGNWVPETGALLSAIQTATNRHHVEFVGKPNGYAFQKVLEQAGCDASECMMIGDNPYTDIKGAYLAGMRACWISYGREFPKDLNISPSINSFTMLDLAKTIMFDHVNHS